MPVTSLFATAVMPASLSQLMGNRRTTTVSSTKGRQEPGPPRVAQAKYSITPLRDSAADKLKRSLIAANRSMQKAQNAIGAVPPRNPEIAANYARGMKSASLRLTTPMVASNAIAGAAETLRNNAAIAIRTKEVRRDNVQTARKNQQRTLDKPRERSAPRRPEAVSSQAPETRSERRLTRANGNRLAHRTRQVAQEYSRADSNRRSWGRGWSNRLQDQHAMDTTTRASDRTGSIDNPQNSPGNKTFLGDGHNFGHRDRARPIDLDKPPPTVDIRV